MDTDTSFVSKRAGKVVYVKNVRRPWWQATSTVRQAYVIGGLCLLLGASQLAFVPGGDPFSKWLHLVTGSLFILMAVGCLTSGTMLRRRTSAAATEPLTCPLDSAGKAEIDSLLASGKVMPAVRRARELTGLPLVDAKRLVDSLRR